MQLFEAVKKINYDPSWAVYADAPFIPESEARFGQTQFENGGALDTKEFFANGDQIGVSIECAENNILDVLDPTDRSDESREDRIKRLMMSDSTVGTEVDRCLDEYIREEYIPEREEWRQEVERITPSKMFVLYNNVNGEEQGDPMTLADARKLAREWDPDHDGDIASYDVIEDGRAHGEGDAFTLADLRTTTAEIVLDDLYEDEDHLMETIKSHGGTTTPLGDLDDGRSVAYKFHDESCIMITDAGEDWFRNFAEMEKYYKEEIHR